jgi:hypothetical protein
MTFTRLLGRQLVYAFSILARLGLGCLFLYSALPKIRQPYDFLRDVYAYEIVGPQLGVVVAMTLPWLELLIAICLLGGVFIGGAFLVSAGLAALFSVVITWALYQGLNITCGCFGSSTEVITYVALIRAIGILLTSLLAYMAAVWGSPHRPASTLRLGGTPANAC